MKYIFGILLMLVSAHALSACTKTNIGENALTKDGGAYNFAEMLSRTDEVETCTKYMDKTLTLEVGPGFLPAGLTQLGCTCASDTARYTAELAGASPVLANAGVQMSLNMDVHALMRRDNSSAFLALHEYFRTESQKELGFNIEDWKAMGLGLEAVSTRLGSMPADEAKSELLANAPSCKQLDELVVRNFPNLDTTATPLDLDSILAKQKLEYDAQISISEIDGILTTNQPEQVCLRHIEKMCQARADECLFDVRKATPEASCIGVFIAAESAFSDLSEDQQHFGIRYILASIYMAGNRTTAPEQALGAYVKSRTDYYGLSSAEIDEIEAAMDAHFAPKDS